VVADGEERGVADFSARLEQVGAGGVLKFQDARFLGAVQRDFPGGRGGAAVADGLGQRAQIRQRGGAEAVALGGKL
jgi:hypothetical protein